MRCTREPTEPPVGWVIPADMVATTAVAAIIIGLPPIASIATFTLALATVGVNGITHRLSVSCVSESVLRLAGPALLQAQWLPPPQTPEQSEDAPAEMRR